jgi:hypothetical protein
MVKGREKRILCAMYFPFINYTYASDWLDNKKMWEITVREKWKTSYVDKNST